MATKLEELIAKLNTTTPYTALSSQQIQQQAASRYQSVYDQKRMSAQHSYETEDAALGRQLAGLQESYDRERAQSEAQTRQTYAQAGRHALSRGMQRSSYTGATLANIDLAGDRALEEISRAQTAQENDISEQRTQLSRQLADQLSQYDADQLRDQLAYQDELEAREYDRMTQSVNTHNELAMKIYEYQHQLEQEAVEQARWQAEFNAKYGSKKRSSSGSKKKNTDAGVSLFSGGSVKA